MLFILKALIRRHFPCPILQILTIAFLFFITYISQFNCFLFWYWCTRYRSVRRKFVKWTGWALFRAYEFLQSKTFQFRVYRTWKLNETSRRIGWVYDTDGVRAPASIHHSFGIRSSIQHDTFFIRRPRFQGRVPSGKSVINNAQPAAAALGMARFALALSLAVSAFEYVKKVRSGRTGNK